MVFYFSATGNSLYVAKMLESAPSSIAQSIHDELKDYTDSAIGIVAPIYGHELPALVKDFLRQARFHTDYLYLILTYGNRHANAAELAQDFLRECGLSANYINYVLMADNFLPGFDMNEQRTLDKHIHAQLADIQKDISARKHWIVPITDADRAVHQEFLERMARIPADAFHEFYHITGGCIGCGICTKVCPKACFSVESQRARWNGQDCISCMACIHACPQKAIQLNMPEKNSSARYRNEHVTLCEIVKANCQSCCTASDT